VPLVCGRGEQLPFASGSFDTVVSTFPTPFILASETLHAVHRVLRPGGQLVIVPQAYLTGRGPLARFVNWLYVITGQRPETMAPGAARRPPVAWLERVHAHGFQLEVALVTLPRSEVMVVIARNTGPQF
jgi:SAM-dependent methyltransferase